MIGRVGTKIAVLAVAGLLVWHASGTMPAQVAAPLEGVSEVAVGVVSSAAGMLGGGTTQQALAAPQEGAAGWVAGAAGDGVGWRTCKSVPFLVNTGDADPALADILVAEAVEAFARVGAASGMRFAFAGRTDALPRNRWPLSDVRVDGYRYAPVLVGWVRPEQTDLLTPGTWGSTVVSPAGSGAKRRLVSAVVALDYSSLDQLAPGFGEGQTRGNLVLHEVAHVAGLGHLEAGGLMAPVVGPDSPDGLSPAELEGLAELGPRC